MVAFNQMGGDAPAEEWPAVTRRALELRQLVVKDDDVLWVGDARGDVYPGWLPALSAPDYDDTLAAVRVGWSDGAGIYHRGRRILSCCVLAIQGETLPPPVAAEPATFEARLAFPELRGKRDDLSAFRAFVADGAAVHQWITLESQALHAAPVRVTLTLACDGMTVGEEDAGHESGGLAGSRRLQSWLEGERATAGRPYTTTERDARTPPPALLPQEGGVAEVSHMDGATLLLVYRNDEGAVRRTAITFDREPFEVRWLGAYDIAGVPARVAVSFHLYPALAEPAILGFTVRDAESGNEAPRVEGFAVSAAPAEPLAASAAVRDRHARAVLQGARYSTQQPALDATLRRAAADLRLLATRNDVGDLLPGDGLDGLPEAASWEALLAGFQSLALDPAYAAHVLRGLAPYVVQPLAESAALRVGAQVAPLWVALLGETLEWTGDVALFDELLPQARATVRDLERRADCHGYLRSCEQIGAAAICLEPQVAMWMARRALARALRRRGSAYDHAEIAALELGAETLRQRIERDFWLAGEECYAAALDDACRPLQTVTSAAAYALWARMAGGPRAARLAARLALPDLASGWGLRSRSAEHPEYDALDQTAGAVWTHETAFAAIGLLRTGHSCAGLRLARAVFAVAEAQLDARLPTYIGGQPQSGLYETAPLWCPGARMPSAAAVASPIALTAAMLGCEPDALGGRLTLRPVLPAWMRRVSVRHLRVGGARIDLDVTRVGADGTCEVSARVTQGSCAVQVQPASRAYA